MTGSGDAKRLIIHFYIAEARDMCVNSTHSAFPDLQFHLYDPKQLRSDEDLRAIQVTDIPFFITKSQLQSYFKKFSNLLSLHLYSRKGAKMQQARIVYDHADAISRFTTQWAVYCFSTCLRVTPCHYSIDQKAARREFVAVLSGLPANTKDIHLAPLVKEHGAKAINIPLSLNSYKPKPWAYVTFNSQETMDAAMEQTIGFQGHTLRWGSSNDSKALCHRCAAHGRALSTNRKGKDRSVSFSSTARALIPDLNSSSAFEATLNILNILKSLQLDVARVESRISNLELNNKRLSVIEARLGIDPPPTPVANSDTDRMEEDPPETGTLIPHPSAPLVPGSKMSSPPKSTPIKASHPVSTSNFNPSPQDELNSVINDQKAIKDTLQSLTGSIQGFIASLKGSPSDRADSAPSQ
ncbi:hypothetical protein RhiirC2_826968 [Rhizophagus irregularis]|uniref:RRM domain-containing protein n=1 Tax=Rhizophagus irregularis TaxID=588596 RepID=A0A2N1M5Z5_9GLOM|nr:hypothetical protein RhiirC2_826968 [Rhizophagus irregularis]